MEEDFYGAAYKGSKQFSQQQVKTANATGFGAAADDYMERGIDLNEQLIMNKPATFFFRMKGDAMQDAGIYDGDVLIVDRSIKAAGGKIVVGSIDGELFVRRYVQTFNKTFLQPENKKYRTMEVGEFVRFDAWGVVTCVIHIVDPMLAVFASKANTDKPIR
ncbi:MAG: translesion error-prone DNA polymerase V autoproteolytic subunit [Chitinophagaceae bacterium]|nr:translesion error-prone DNA polymerase V autoproteolytic subunit [Chitinophagaceae bacterium]